MAQPILIAYSITDFGVDLLTYTPHKKSVALFGEELLLQYASYVQDQPSPSFDILFTYDQLANIHEALASSRNIHLLHDNWEFTLHSSIRFFIHERQASWIQPWHLTRQFNNDREWYTQYLQDQKERFVTMANPMDYIEI